MQKMVMGLFTIFMLFVLVAGCDKAKSQQKSEQPAASEKSAITQDAVAQAQAEMVKKNYGQAVEILKPAANAEPKNAKALFVLAEAQGASADIFGSLKSLDEALKSGYDNKTAIYASEYLVQVRASSGFKELMAKYGMAQAKSGRSTTYKSEDEIRAGDVRINMKESFKDDK